MRSLCTGAAAVAMLLTTAAPAMAQDACAELRAAAAAAAAYNYLADNGPAGREQRMQPLFGQSRCDFERYDGTFSCFWKTEDAGGRITDPGPLYQTVIDGVAACFPTAQNGPDKLGQDQVQGRVFKLDSDKVKITVDEGKNDYGIANQVFLQVRQIDHSAELQANDFR